MTDEEHLAKLEATKPKRERFATEEEFEESVGFWMSRQGRMIARLRASIERRRRSLADGQEVPIIGAEYWFKVVEMLQQNWALLQPKGSGATVWFVDDESGVFDQLEFSSSASASRALRMNGFRSLENARATDSILPIAPLPPYRTCSHPSGPIYSSGQYWVGA